MEYPLVINCDNTKKERPNFLELQPSSVAKSTGIEKKDGNHQPRLKNVFDFLKHCKTDTIYFTVSTDIIIFFIFKNIFQT